MRLEPARTGGGAEAPGHLARVNFAATIRPGAPWYLREATQHTCGSDGPGTYEVGRLACGPLHRTNKSIYAYPVPSQLLRVLTAISMRPTSLTRGFTVYRTSLLG